MVRFDTSIIIVNHNTSEALKECVNSLFKFENDENLEIIIVDNGSKDNSKNIIEELINKYKTVCAIYFDDVKSFSYANNRGIEKSSGKCILVMNPDIIFENEVIGKLKLQLNENRKIGAIAPALVGIDNKFQKYYYQRYPTIKQFIFFHSVILRFFYKIPWFINRYYLDNKIKYGSNKKFRVNMIPGAFIFTTREVLNEIGLLDENFVLFYEDTDLSYRISEKYELIVDTRLYVKHLGGASFKEIEWWIYGRFITSMIYFFKKHYNILHYLALKNIAVINALIMLFIENIFKIFGKQNNFRIKKYKNFLDLVKEI